MKIFGHSQVLSNELLNYLSVAKPAFWKTLNHDPSYYKRVIAAVPGIKIIGRSYNDPTGWEIDPEGAATLFATRCINEQVSQQHLVWAWEVPNETLNDSTNFTLWDRFQATFYDRLREHGLEAIALCAGEGNLDETTASKLPLTLSRYRYYGFHEYDFPNIDRSVGDRALRYRRIMAPILAARPDARAIITEWGLTQATYGGPDIGWKTAKSAPSFFHDDISWYNARIEEDNYVLGAALFQISGDGGWTTFETIDTDIPQKLVWSDQDRTNAIKEVEATAPMKYELLNYPTVNQLDQANTDPNKYNDCGEACILSINKYLGLPMATESVWQIKTDETSDPSFIGYSTTDQMVTWFTSRGHAAIQTQPSDLISVINDFLSRGEPVVYLRYWNIAARTGGHFEVICGSDPDTSQVMLMNPWGGLIERQSYDYLISNSLGNYLVIVKEAIPVTDALIVAARAHYSIYGYAPNEQGAIWAGYLRKFKAWVDSGYDNILDPTGAIRLEWSNGVLAYVPLRNMEIMSWHSGDAKLYLVESDKREEVWTECKW